MDKFEYKKSFGQNFMRDENIIIKKYMLLLIYLII